MCLVRFICRNFIFSDTLCQPKKAKPIRSLSDEPINFRDLDKKVFNDRTKKTKLKGRQ